MRKITSLILICFAVFAKAQTYSGPESVVFDSSQNRYFISNNTANQILERSSNGTLRVFTNAINSGPHGLEIVGNTLYTCDGNSLKGFDLNSGSNVFSVNLGATFLNGICTDGVDYLFATDFSAKKIYKIHIPTQTFTVFVSGLTKSPNGIIYDNLNQRIVWVTWGTNAPIMQATLADSVVSQVIPTTLSNCDGIVRDGVGNYYVSAWGGQGVYKFNNTFSGAAVQVISGLSNPADIYYNLSNDSLVSPNSGNNTVTFHYMGTASNLNDIEKAEIKIYPNPCSNFLNIDLENEFAENLLITDQSGKTILEMTNLNSKELRIDISDFPEALYFISLKKGKEMHSSMFRVKR
jgi:hypothetical protein